MRTGTNDPCCTPNVHPHGGRSRWWTSIFLIYFLFSFVMSQEATESISEEIPVVPGCRVYEREESKMYVVQCSQYDVFSTPLYLPVNTVKIVIYQVSELPTNVPLTGNLSQLHEFSVTSCQLKVVNSIMFRGLPNLKYLDLKKNLIRELQNDTFAHNRRLEQIDLSGNLLTSIVAVTKAISGLRNLRTLTLSENMFIRYITIADFLPMTNIPLERLDLSTCTISQVEKSSFVPLSSLSSLDVSGNAFDPECLGNLSSDLHLTNISELGMNNLRYISHFPRTVLSDLSKLNLELLDLSYNRFVSFPSSFYKHVKLKYLDLTSCSISDFFPDSFDGMRNLETLKLKKNSIFSIGSEFSPLHNLKYLDLSKPTNERKGASITIVDYAFRNQGKLENLIIDYFPIRKHIGRFMLHGLYNLKTLSMSNALVSGIQDFAFETLNNLEMLTLSDNVIESIHNNSFFGLTKVKLINLENNGLTFLSYTCPFDHTPFLETLILSDNKINHLPPCLFLKTKNIGLIRARNNLIVPWKSRLFPWKENLAGVGLSSNKITFFTSFMLDDLRGLENVDFSYNPLNCSACGMLDVQTWMRESNTSFSPFRTFRTDVEPYYACYSPADLRGHSFTEVEIPTSHCFVGVLNVMLLLISVFCPLLALALLAVITWHFWSWNIRYCCFHLKLKVRSYRDTTTADSFTYDAFVSHSHSDVTWVRDHLLPALENDETHSRLCIPDRDFNASCYITENVLSAVTQSRTTILVLSNGYLDSQWCQFDLDMALHKLFEDTRNGLILVLLGEIEKSKLTKNLKYIMRTRTCIPWTDNPIGQKLFWQRLRLAIAKPSEKDLLKHIT